MVSSFPPLTPSYILSFQFGSWYPQFSNISIKSTVIPLSNEFRQYLEADSIFFPEGSEDFPVESLLSDDDDDADEQDSDPDTPDSSQQFSFPELDAQIRACVKEYGAVFPKLNFSSPRDAAWVLPAGSPLKCTSPADVYMLLKSSDFINHDLSTESVFQDCLPLEDAAELNLHLVLRKWYSIDCSRELRCFVRKNRLIGISQRDTNYYEFLNEPETRTKIIQSVANFWQAKIKQKWTGSEDYIFDVLLTKDLSRAHIIDFNPYAPKTDSLLFTYDELAEKTNSSNQDDYLELRVIDSRTHVATTSNAPAHQHNMVPFEALSLGHGRSIEEFADQWREGLLDTMQEDD